MLKNRLIILLCTCFMMIVGCSSSGGSHSNTTPVVTEKTVYLTMEKNSSLTLTTEHVQASDAEGDALILVVTPDENSTALGATVTPTVDYVGDLYVKVAVNDGNSTSEDILIRIAVLDVITLHPLNSGSWWDYSDKNYGEVTASKATLGDSVLLNGDSYIPLSWSTMEDLNVSFLFSSDETGVFAAGGISPTDTMISPVLYVPNKAVPDETWNYSPIEYVKTDNKFRLSEAVTMKCIAADSIVSLPAGVFNCAVYQYSYTNSYSRSAISGIRIYSPVRAASGETTYTERLFFTPGIGLVKAETSTGGVVIYTKELTDWSGNQG